MPVIHCLVLLLSLFVLFPGLAFGSIAADVTVSTDGASASSTITSPVFTTSAGNEQLLAFISTDFLSGTNTTVKSVTGASLTWTLIKRTNTQKGTAEIWGAFAASPLTGVSVSATLSQSVVASITVMSFVGVNPAGAIGATNGNSGATGAPTASLVTTGSNSWVLGVGNDYTNATARTLGTGQVLVHQDLAPTGDTYWVQRQANAIPASGTTVTINDTAPTKDKFNLSIVEVLAALSGSTYGISGTVSPSTIGSGATVTLSGTSSATTVADANGNYSFAGLVNGSYTVTPSKTGDTFTPVNQAVTVNGANQTAVNFTGQAITYSISGTVSPSTIGSGATVTLSGTSSATTVADANGNYSFAGLANGSYTVTPSKAGDTFSPVNQAITVNGANQTAVNFTGQATVSYSISGTVSPSTIGSGATVTLSGTSSATTVADANGNYSFAGLANGSYTVTPSQTGDTFTPVNQAVTVSGANQTGINFTGQAASYSISGSVGGSSCSGCSYVQSTHSSQSGNTDWPTLLNVKAGDALVYIGEFSNWTAGATVNMTDSHGDTWYRCDNNATTDFVEVQDQSTYGMSCHYTVNIAAWPTITAQPVASQCVSTSCTQVGGTFFELALPANATANAWAIPNAGTSTSGSNNVNCGSITLPQSNDFLMCDFNNASGTPTAGTTPVPFTMRETTVTAIETGLYSGSGTIIPTGTLNASGIEYTGITVAFAPSSGLSGATITLSGASTASTVADVNGNYSFPGLGNGSYTVTPSKSGYTFTPASQAVTISGANQTAVNFTAQAVGTTWSISGTISPTAGGSGATVVLSGATSANTVADANGNYTFTGLANGAYTITPSLAGYVFTPPNQAVTINSANQTAVNFTAVPVVTTWSISGTISPAAGGSGATVTLSGTSDATTVANASGNYTFSGLANGSYTITPTLTGYTYTPPSQAVTINSANQTAINFTAVPVVTTWSISGTISPATGGSGATVTLGGTSSASSVANASGNYTFSGLANGYYTVTPTLTGYTYTPPSQAVTINSANQTAVNFTAQPVVTTWSVSGTISPAAGGSGATVTLGGTSSASTVADANGNYTFTGLANGAYTITPSQAGYTFTPASQAVTINSANQTGVNFTAQAVAGSWSISGTIAPITGGSGASVALTGASSATTVTDANGNYTFSGLQNGSYTVTPTQVGYTYSPLSQQVTVANANQSGINFTAAAALSSIMLDVNTSQDGAKAGTTIASSVFSTAVANELVVAFVTADYIKGTNTTVTGVAGGGLTWTLVQRANLESGDSEIWEAFAPSTLSGVSVTATLSQSVISSITVMSFEGVNTSGTNGSGAIGATATNGAASGAPTASLVTLGSNSWVVGVGNDYDNATARTIGPGQVLVHQDLTSTGDTYWVQRETSAVPASGTIVTINDTAPTKDRFNLAIAEIIAAGSSKDEPPTVSMNSPVAGALVSGTVSVSATASDVVAVSGVQFLLDGAPLGAEVTSSPYSFNWDTTAATTGPHTLSARATDTAGLSTTSAAISVTVGNSTQAPLTGSWSTPVTLPAVAVNLILLPNNRVMFYQDGTTPTVWDYLAGTFKTIPLTPDIFCSGHALLSDGRILVVGGYGGSGTTIGIKNADIFDPVALTWTAVPNMEYARWYPNATTLSDGRIIVLAGWQTSANTNAGISEIYDPVANTWTSLTNANNPFETYPFMYLMPDGRLIHIGGSEYATDTDVLDLTSDTWSVIDSNIVDGGSATMYLPFKFMKAGSASDSQESGPSSNTTFVLDMTQPAPAWQQTASMANARSFMNLTMLPDGTVLATGGETDKNGGNIANAVYAAEMWSPTTQTWATMASMQTPREYHGTALLLPDGRVLESGMGADFGNVPNELSAEFYSPPYLFKGSRPNITQAPAQIQYGTNFFVATPDAPSITSVSLIRTGAVTHFFDQNERFLPLAFTQTTGGLTVTAPVNGNLAPPGYYMLFIVNSSGVPSIAPFVQIP